MIKGSLLWALRELCVAKSRLTDRNFSANKFPENCFYRLVSIPLWETVSQSWQRTVNNRLR